MIIQYFQQITPPDAITSLTPDTTGGGLVRVINLGLQFIFIAAGLYTFWNFINAGFILLGSAGDSKKLNQARDKFMWTLLGLVVMISAIVVAGIIGQLVYGKWDAIIQPEFKTTE